MSSSALLIWRGERNDRLAELYDAHATIGGIGAGKRFRTEQLNLALVLRLAGEFQGFARDLHDAAVVTFSSQVGGSNLGLQSLLQVELTRNRQLSRANAQPASLRDDFDRLGFDLWKALDTRDARTPGRRTKLKELNKMRNDVAHVNAGSLSTVRYTVTLAQVRIWHRALDGLAGSMDAVVADHLATFLGIDRPW